jgi:hypothetical protein
LKYIVYVLLLYIFLPFNHVVDIIAILLFVAHLKENPYFVLPFAFFAGLLLDLYYPVMLGFHMLTYLILIQLLVFVRKYLAHQFLIMFALFLAYYITKIIASALVLRTDLRLETIGLTIMTFGVISTITYVLPQRSWMKM